MIWIGTYKGLAVLNPQTDNFINYKSKTISSRVCRLQFIGK